MKKRNTSIFIVLIAFCGNLAAQSLDFAQAVEMMLRNNYDIGISRNDFESAQNNNNIGNAGFLPSLDAAGQYEVGSSNTNITFFTDTTISRTGAQRQDLTGSLTLDWTIFDGFRMFARKQELEASEQFAENALRAQIEVSTLDLAQIYYSIVFEQQLLPVYEQNLKISQSRLKIVQQGKSVGSASGLDVDQALIDVSNDSIRLLQQQNRVQNLQEDLWLVLGDTTMAKYSLGENIIIDSTMNFANLKDSLYRLNSNVLTARSQVDINQSLIKQARAAYYPEISLFGNLGYNYSLNEVGQVQQLRSYGPSAGIRVRFNLFNGFNDRRQIVNSRLNYQSAQIELNRSRQQTTASLQKSFNDYRYYLTVLQLREANIKRAQKTVDVGLKQLQLGLINNIDFRTIQLTFLQAENDLFDARYNAKLAALQLKVLSGIFSLKLR